MAGSGAVAAGQPYFAYPPRAARAPVSPREAPHPGWGFVGRRVLAFLLDALVSSVLGLAAVSATVWKLSWSPRTLLEPGVWPVVLGFLLVSGWAVFAVQEVMTATTFGKSVFGLRLNPESGPIRRLVRAVLFVISAVFCGVGMLWVIADPRRRCWHDIAAGLEVVERDSFLATQEG